MGSRRLTIGAAFRPDVWLSLDRAIEDWVFCVPHLPGVGNSPDVVASIGRGVLPGCGDLQHLLQIEFVTQSM